MAQPPAARAGASEQFVDVLALALAGQLHQAEFGELGDLGTGGVVAAGLGEVLEQLQLIASRLHVDEVDDHHTTDVAQLQLAGDLDRRLTVGPQHRLAGVGGPGERPGVDVDHRQGFGGLDDHVAARGEIDPGFEGIADGGVDPEVLQDLGGFPVVLHQQIRLVGPQEIVDAGHRIGAVDDHPQHVGAVEVAQHPMDEVLIPVEQHGGRGRLGGLLDRLPLPQQALEIVDQHLLADVLGLGADQQTGPGGLDQHPEGPQPVALVLPVDAPGDVHPLAMGLEHQEATRKGEVAGEAGPLGARGLLHHLDEDLLPGLEQLGDASSALPEPQRPQVGDVDETVLLAFADVDEGGIDPRQHVFDGSEIDVADLVTALGDDQFIDAFVVEHCGDPQLLSDDDLLGHGGVSALRGALPEGQVWGKESGADHGDRAATERGDGPDPGNPETQPVAW